MRLKRVVAVVCVLVVSVKLQHVSGVVAEIVCKFEQVACRCVAEALMMLLKGGAPRCLMLSLTLR